MYVVCVCVSQMLQIYNKIDKEKKKRCTSRLSVQSVLVVLVRPHALHRMGARLVPTDCRPKLKRT